MHGFSGLLSVLRLYCPRPRGTRRRTLMRLIDAWRLSRIPYGEVAYRSIAQTRNGMWWGSFGKRDPEKAMQSDTEFILRALRIARFDKVVVGVVSVFASLLPFWWSLSGSTANSIVGAVSLSLATSFAFVMLYAVQTLSSFLSAESWTCLSTLPLAKQDLSMITLFSFVRTVDYMVLGAVASQVIVVAFLTASLFAAAATLLASAVNMLLAVTLSLWFSRLFYGNMARGGRSRRGTLLRIAFLGLWGLLLVSLGFLFSAASYLMPYLNNVLIGGEHGIGSALAAVYPFSLAIVVAGSTGPGVASPLLATALVAAAFYAGLSAYLLRWSLGTIREMSQASGISHHFAKAGDFLLRVRSPLFGYVWKDLRASSRNPATAFFYALPVFETVVVLLSTMSLPVLRASIVLVATAMGGAFTLFMPLGLLNAEGGGLSYTIGLPVKVSTIVSAKAVISTLAFLPVPLVMVALALFRPVTSSFILLLPLVVVASAAAGSLVEVWLFLGVSAETRTSAVLHDMVRLLAGVSLMLLPELAYAGAYIVSFDHALSVLAGAVIAAFELGAVVLLVRHPR